MVLLADKDSRKIQAVPSTAHGMLKFPVCKGIVTLHNNTVVPTKCRMVAKAATELPPNEPTTEKGVKEAIHPDEHDGSSEIHSGTPPEHP
ncbi:hypothetical protein Tco_1081294 [Tanacetum coccineum]|uniref:Reverse transcriptase domain-containing protein n=1 Tax=Tanacetum coccineum TaxID=301880 RepID=A0ABQ5HY29_9ASTR